jgi:hypothetical protein
MSAERAKQDVQVSVGRDFVIVGGDRVEVGPRPHSDVVVYTNGVVQRKNMPPPAATGTYIAEDFNTVVMNGATVERAADGHFVISTPGIVLVKRAAANDGLSVPPIASSDVSRLLSAKTAPKIGDLDDGGVYVGLSASDGKALHAALADEPDYLTFDEALEAAARMRKLPGCANAHVPTAHELDVNLYRNKDVGFLKGTFNTSGSYPDSCYRSSSPGLLIGARVQWFDDGCQDMSLRHHRLPVRLVW